MYLTCKIQEMKSLLAFFVATDQQDYTLRGAYRNAMTGITRINTYQMFGCWTPPFARIAPEPVLTQIKLNRIDLSGGTRKVISTSLLNLAMFKLTHLNAASSRWEGDLTKKFGQPEPGVYELELADSHGGAWFSNPFLVETKCSNYPTTIVKFLTNSPGSGIFVFLFNTNSPGNIT
jgi:hypothetical protein